LTFVGDTTNAEHGDGCENSQDHDHDEQFNESESLISAGLHCFFVDIHVFSFQLTTVIDALDIGTDTLG
jgi:hypothetical protein